MTNSDHRHTLAAWEDYQKTPWGRLFYTVEQANLLRHLDAPPCEVLDVGGGNGLDAIFLARQGYDVALLDPDPAMLGSAQRLAASTDVAVRVQCYEGDITHLPSQFEGKRYDVVLCHNVLQYVEDATVAIANVCSLLADGGMVSLICGNRYAESYTAALQRFDLKAALEDLDLVARESLVLAKAINLYTVGDILPLLESARCMLIKHYGIRCVTDYISDNHLKHDETFFNHLERLEQAISDRYPYYLLARYFQLIARKS